MESAGRVAVLVAGCTQAAAAVAAEADTEAPRGFPAAGMEEVPMGRPVEDIEDPKGLSVDTGGPRDSAVGWHKEAEAAAAAAAGHRIHLSEAVYTVARVSRHRNI